jgi:predicted glycosyltransferase involved in capsule biosynthesis
MSNITIIVPLDLGQRPVDILRKARRLAKATETAQLTIIFGHNDRGTFFDRILKLLLSPFKHTQLISENSNTTEVNTSHLRNIAFDKTSTEFLVLLDVDIWPDLLLIEKYRLKVSLDEKPYYMLPCLYLTRRGSKDLTDSKITTDELKNRFFGFSRKEFLHLASPSSVTVMRRKDYFAIGGFNASYSGHGYEDFDFMMRLAKHHNKLDNAPDMLLDKTARSPLFSVGFRRHLGMPCLEALLEKDIVFHLYHEKTNIANYSAARKRNYETFKGLHEHCVGGVSKDDPTLISTFAKLCSEKQKDISEFSIFFDNKPGHIDRFDSFRRRLRFLLND